MTDKPQPTPQDLDNAARRADIAAGFRRQYEEALALAEQALGPLWEPTGRYYLVAKDDEDRCRHTNAQPSPVATVYSAEKDGEKKYFTVREGVPVECASKEAGFGALLLEPHPTKTCAVKGVEYPIHRYSLCWGWFEPDYRPQSAEQLADARAKREEKAEAKWRQQVEAEAAGSLFPEWIREQAEEARKQKKGKPR